MINYKGILRLLDKYEYTNGKMEKIIDWYSSRNKEFKNIIKDCH